ncbi:MAG: rod shape-determining protein MreC [Saprospirales bacterium]|nr:rod shape-determining protein MreC [Saprospirales bacterium]MBK8493115.1 rod shape-determining protein MreC [Saprospirales bacterium]
MRDLLLLFLRFGGVLLFIILEAFSFILIVQFNQEQRAIFDNSWVNFTATADEKLDYIFKFATLGEVNDSLAAVNARLYEEVFLYRQAMEHLEEDTLRPYYLDSLLMDTVYQLIPAKIIRNSISEHHNYLILDKGSDDGVTANMGVVLDNGIVGVTSSVGRRHALVMSILHRQARPSASIKGTNYFGSLRWEEKNTRELLLENVPKHAYPSKGDTIVSSGYSLIFPKDIPIGTIQSIDSSDGGSDTYKILVKLFADLASLDRVYVVKKSTQKEQVELVQQAQNE